MAQPQVLPAGWVPNDVTFGARLALIRQAMGWTNLKEAAEECGVSVQTWRNWEAGKGGRMGTVRDAVDKITRRTGCDYYWLLDGPRKGVGFADHSATNRQRNRHSLDASAQVTDLAAYRNRRTPTVGHVAQWSEAVNHATLA